jgi:hypothetical protein
MGLPETVLSTGRNAVYQGLPRLDEAAAQMMSYGNRGLDPVIAAMRSLRKSGSVALDVINPDREDERSARADFRHRLGQVVVVGGFDESSGEMAAEASADSLWQSRVINKASIVGVRPLTHTDDVAEHNRLIESASLANHVLQDRYDIASTIVSPEDPARVPQGQADNPRTLHETIQRADAEYNNWVHDTITDRGYRGEVVPHTTSLLVADPAVAEAMDGIEVGDLRNGGAALLIAVRKGWRHLWKPLDRVSQTAHEKLSSEDSLEVVTDDYVGRDRRFHVDRRQTQERIAIQHDRRRNDRREHHLRS